MSTLFPFPAMQCSMIRFLAVSCINSFFFFPFASFSYTYLIFYPQKQHYIYQISRNNSLQMLLCVRSHTHSADFPALPLWMACLLVWGMATFLRLSWAFFSVFLDLLPPLLVVYSLVLLEHIDQ